MLETMYISGTPHSISDAAKVARTRASESHYERYSRLTAKKIEIERDRETKRDRFVKFTRTKQFAAHTRHDNVPSGHIEVASYSSPYELIIV